MELECGHLKYVYKEYRYPYLTFTWGGGENFLNFMNFFILIQFSASSMVVFTKIYFKKHRLNKIIHLLTNKGVLVPFIADGVYLWFV